MRALNTSTGLLAAMICIIVLLCAPSRADAHAGHAHAVTSTDAPQSKNAMPQAKVSQPEASTIEQSLTAFEPSRVPNTKSGCVGGCCSQVSHACCALMLPLPCADDGSSFVHARAFGLPRAALSGYDPAALRRPPRSFT